MSTGLPVCSNKLPVVVDGLDAYLQKVNSVPLLSAEEEKSLALRYRNEGDLMAAQQLVLAHLRYVVRIAKGYGGYGLTLNDLIQEGTIGLMKAVKRFDPELGVRLVSFAVHWVKSEIHDYVIRNWRIVKVATTKAQRKLFFNLRGAKKRLGWFSAAEVKAVAEDLGVTTQDVLEMESRLNAHDDSFDPMDVDDEFENAPAHYLAGPIEYNPESAIIHNHSNIDAKDQLANALQALDARSLDIVSNRWLSESKASLKELAEKYNVSIERIRQLEKAAMMKLKENVVNSELV